MPSIDVSVIIPTYNRKSSLQITLDLLKKQTWSHERIEVIVVDDGSMDDTPSIAVQAFPYKFKYIRQENQGSAAARNRGAEESHGDILVFIDDDILLEPEYIAGLIEEHNHFNRIVGMGTCLPYLNEKSSVFERIQFSSILPLTEKRESEFVDYQDCVTNNLSVRYQDFYKIGKMQDVAGDGPTWWGDIDFGYRAHLDGFRFRRSAKAICYHNDNSTRDLRSSKQRAYKVSQMAVLLIQKYPEMLPDLPMFRDKNPIDWKQDSISLIFRKVARTVASTPAITYLMEALASAFERWYPSPRLLHPLYRWITGSYIYRGFRQGLRAYGRLGSE